MKEDYVSYELAKKLKECGFDEPCDKWIASKSFSYYDEDECCDHNGVVKKGWFISQKNKERYDQDALPYLTLWQAQKWLREKKNWHIIVEPIIWWGLTYEFKLWHESRVYENDNRGFYFSSYEAALSAGIKQTLELINTKS